MRGGPFQRCGFGGRGQGLSAPAEDAPVGPGISAAPQKKKKKIKIPLAFFGGLCYDASCVYRRSSMEKEVKIQ